LKEKQSGERTELRQAWKDRKTERERVNIIIQKRDNIREKSKDILTPEEAKQKEKFNRVRRARSQNRKRKGRKRGLRQKITGE
jgi:hypothetical protein